MRKHIPRKRFGQNFLNDRYIINEIIKALNPQIDEHIVEIGPGQGAITTELLKSSAQIDAIELDRDLYNFLLIQLSRYNNLKLHNADILSFDLHSIYRHKKIRLFGNLPYNISSPLLFKVFDSLDIIQDMLFMLQKEVAERLIATPNNKTYGRLSVMAQYYCSMQIIIDVAPKSFNPAPKVDSSVVYFKPHIDTKMKVTNTKLLQQITTAAFSQRRKTISNSLKDIISPLILEKLQINPKLRAENLSLNDYVNLVNYLDNTHA